MSTIWGHGQRYGCKIHSLKIDRSRKASEKQCTFKWLNIFTVCTAVLLLPSLVMVYPVKLRVQLLYTEHETCRLPTSPPPWVNTSYQFATREIPPNTLLNHLPRGKAINKNAWFGGLSELRSLGGSVGSSQCYTMHRGWCFGKGKGESPDLRNELCSVQTESPWQAFFDREKELE